MTDKSISEILPLLEQWQKNPERFLNDFQNNNIETPILIEYLESINLFYIENMKQQQLLDDLQSNLKENTQIINKKMEIYEDKISVNKQKIGKLRVESNNDKGRLKSFFDRLQETNDQEISQKKIKFLQSEIEELTKIKKKTDQSRKTFTQLEDIDYTQRNKNLTVIMTQIFKRLEMIKLDNLSRDNIDTIYQSMNLSEHRFSNPPVISSYIPNKILYLSLLIPVLGILVYCLK